MAKPLSEKNPKKQLDSFLAKYNPEISSLARSALAKMRKRLPGSLEMVYDNYNALVIGFVPNERPSDAIFSIVLPSMSPSAFFRALASPILVISSKATATSSAT